MARLAFLIRFQLCVIMSLLTYEKYGLAETQAEIIVLYVINIVYIIALYSEQSFEMLDIAALPFCSILFRYCTQYCIHCTLVKSQHSALDRRH